MSAFMLMMMAGCVRVILQRPFGKSRKGHARVHIDTADDADPSFAQRVHGALADPAADHGIHAPFAEQCAQGAVSAAIGRTKLLALHLLIFDLSDQK